MSLQDDLIMYGAPGTGQDIDNPVWPSEPVQPEGTQMPVDVENGHEIRTISGPLDLLQHVEEEVFSAFHGDSERNEQRRFLKQPTPVLPVADVLSDSWRGVTFTVLNDSLRIVPKRDDRMRVTVTNTSAAVLLLSHESINPGSIGAISLAANTSREFRTKGEIWATPSVPGTPQTCDIQDEYGVPEWQ